ncbi:MAG: sigma factor [Prolixibacteraceae bacterium]|jgi:DNA-directed RNA polymerase specialized sigma24 family protein|nr:sigma factor [Prolixibacteraceae bacterium]
MDDRQLITKILEQNDQAFSLLVEKYKKLVYCAIFRLVRNTADAEDIFQEVFLEVCRSVHHLSNEDDISA